VDLYRCVCVALDDHFLARWDLSVDDGVIGYVVEW